MNPPQRGVDASQPMAGGDAGLRGRWRSKPSAVALLAAGMAALLWWGLPASDPSAPAPISAATPSNVASPLRPAGPADGSPASIAQDLRCPLRAILEPARQTPRGFYFTRGAYSSDPFSGRGSAWATDFEKADRQLLIVLERVLPVDAFSCENPVRLDDPQLRRFPFLYMVEVGYMRLTPPEVEGLRSYLLQGGFLLVDDFWGSREWASFEREIRRVLPEHEIVEIPMDHLVFRSVYPVREVLQVPSIGNARRGVYHEQDGFVPHMRGIFDEHGRLMVAIAWNSDLGDAWEWAEQPDYPWDRTNYALQMAMNFIVYAMTH